MFLSCIHLCFFRIRPKTDITYLNSVCPLNAARANYMSKFFQEINSTTKVVAPA
uniref:Uncharacterized protein n=1 Tax=Arundo donax TaxID=35708 RepID=A0A0A9BAU4_ARUDO